MSELINTAVCKLIHEINSFLHRSNSLLENKKGEKVPFVIITTTKNRERIAQEVMFTNGHNRLMPSVNLSFIKAKVNP